jgi:methyl-accepting chemotaxis protein
MPIARRKYLVDPRFQLSLVLGANVLALISLSLILTLNAYTQAHLQNYVFELGLPPDHRFSQVLAQREADYARMCLWIGIGLFAIFNFAAIFLSHRIAGPLHRLRRHLEDVADGGEPAEVHFRKGDLYQPLAVACNKLMARLREVAKRP